MLSPVEPKALIADSPLFPSFYNNFYILHAVFNSFFPASSAASCAAKVSTLDPLKPLLPDEDQETVFPVVSVIVIIVLLKVEFICAIPKGIFFFTFFFLILNS